MTIAQRTEKDNEGEVLHSLCIPQEVIKAQQKEDINKQ